MGGLRAAGEPDRPRRALSPALRSTAPVVDVGGGPFDLGRPSAEGGRAAVAAVRARGLQSAGRGDADALVTAPVSKEALRLAGNPWPGQTEMLADLSVRRQ